MTYLPCLCEELTLNEGTKKKQERVWLGLNKLALNGGRTEEDTKSHK